MRTLELNYTTESVAVLAAIDSLQQKKVVDGITDYLSVYSNHRSDGQCRDTLGLLLINSDSAATRIARVFV